MSREVITRASVEDLLAAGRSEVVLGPGAIVTALAREYAQERGLRLLSSPAADAADSPPPNREEIRRAVVAALGSEPAGLLAAIDRVLHA